MTVMLTVCVGTVSSQTTLPLTMIPTNVMGNQQKVVKVAGLPPFTEGIEETPGDLLLALVWPNQSHGSLPGSDPSDGSLSVILTSK